jgi:redox-sensitive bicupin YhaK (pirin superfamily)
MIVHRKAAECGNTRSGWLDGRHSFSFNRYYDPDWMGFRTLRVINDDIVQPSGGFGTHPHQDMEIVTWVLDGVVKHRDSTGSEGEIRPGEAQRMSAGTGIYHSEFNGSATDRVRLLQIWIEPAEAGMTPSYEQKEFPEQERRNRLRVIASQDGREDSVTIGQDAALYDGVLEAGVTVEHPIAAGRSAWVQVAKGKVAVNGLALEEGDGAALSGESSVRILAGEQSEVLVFDLK